MLNILIADDHPIVRKGIRRLCEEEIPSAHVHEVDSGAKVMNHIRSSACDIVILDLHFPDKSGLDIVKEAKSFRPALPILMLSVYPEEHYAVRALKAGAEGYLSKTLAPYELIKAMHAALNGQRFISAGLAQQLLKMPGVEPAPHALLSDREQEVFRLMANGTSTKEIGCMLEISDKTISTYRSRILIKLQLRTTVDIVRYAINHGLIEA